MAQGLSAFLLLLMAGGCCCGEGAGCSVGAGSGCRCVLFCLQIIIKIISKVP